MVSIYLVRNSLSTVHKKQVFDPIYVCAYMYIYIIHV